LTPTAKLNNPKPAALRPRDATILVTATGLEEEETDAPNSLLLAPVNNAAEEKANEEASDPRECMLVLAKQEENLGEDVIRTNNIPPATGVAATEPDRKSAITRNNERSSTRREQRRLGERERERDTLVGGRRAVSGFELGWVFLTDNRGFALSH
jgi:hypothetical protein